MAFVAKEGTNSPGEVKVAFLAGCDGKILAQAGEIHVLKSRFVASHHTTVRTKNKIKTKIKERRGAKRRPKKSSNIVSVGLVLYTNVHVISVDVLCNNWVARLIPSSLEANSN
ncbi:hypothetical protein TWF718_005916 [Orbilia javanica]|uniref:Uncharacterized protein n=1 Tax=Orbilia javanica TaxID=47235 RepID=A0AAN8REJ5_9PEZI